MRWLALASAFVSLLAPAAARHSSPPVAPPPPPLSILPSIARVNVTSHSATTVGITTEINLPRGDYKGEPLHFHIAFGAPGPRAVDVHLVPVNDGALEADDDESGEPLAFEHVPRRPSSAHALLGKESMAGIVVHVRPDALTKALRRGNMATMRIRAVADTTIDASGAASILVRLGAVRGLPLTLGRIVAHSAPNTPALTRVEARLCGPEAETHLLAVGGAPKVTVGAESPPIAPILAVRHVSDDLCLRIWH